jgi:hypothetical protein
MSAFFARFMKMKNIGATWNRAGFVSSRVEFGPEIPTPRGVQVMPVRDDKLVNLKVPVPTGIEKMLDLITTTLNHAEVKADPELLRIRELLVDAIQDHEAGVPKLLAEPSFAKILDNQPGAPVDFEDLITKAISSLNLKGNNVDKIKSPETK